MSKPNDEIFDKYTDPLNRLIQDVVSQKVEMSDDELVELYLERKDKYEELFQELLQYHNRKRQVVYKRRDRVKAHRSNIGYAYHTVGYDKEHKAFWETVEKSGGAEKQLALFPTLKESIDYNKEHVNKHHEPWDFLEE